jgi:ADP-L-glycero-D-manno-heptose 6-epimerase
MDKKANLIITGADGFIGSCLTGFLNAQGFDNLILADAFDDDTKKPNLLQKKYLAKIERDKLFGWLEKENTKVAFFFHLGARTDTTEFDYSIHQKLNVEYSQDVWRYCTQNNIPLVYASSAATYGSGELGYEDNANIIEELKPLNPYGISKNEFDKWAVKQTAAPPFWAGLKFFNVYGPNEYHKGRMASVIFHAFNQIKQNGKVKLFKSHKEGFTDGNQLRDFIYVKDIITVCCWMMETVMPAPGNHPSSLISGLYNLGTGKARSFNDLVKATFAGLDLEPLIEYIDMPEDIRDKYQYFTEARMNKLIEAGYDKPFYSLEEGVKDYVKNYLSNINPANSNQASYF